MYPHRTPLSGEQVHRVYLDELGEVRQLPVWVALMVLTTIKEDQTPEEARYLLSRIGAALSFGGEMILGLGQVPVVWLTAGFLGAFFIPFYSSSYQAIWLAKVEPSVQGRVFAARSFLSQITAPLGYLVAGVLADFVFEPAMMPEGCLSTLTGLRSCGDRSNKAQLF
nr:DUF2887 domain-containing protein [Leptolyngbya sp. 7M]